MPPYTLRRSPLIGLLLSTSILTCSVWGQHYPAGGPGSGLALPSELPGPPATASGTWAQISDDGATIPVLPTEVGSSSRFAASYPVDRQGLPDTYVDLDYLLWNLGDAHLPPILTSNPSGTPGANVANAADPSTQTLIGNEQVGDWVQHGMRLRVGRMYCGGMVSRLELSGLFFFDGSDTWNYASQNGDPILARPFTNALTGQPDAQVVSFAGVASGSLEGNYKRRLYGFDPLVFFCLGGNGQNSTEFFTGYRFLRYEDELRVTERVQPMAGNLIAPGSQLLVEDVFRATNSYHLIPLGLSHVTIGDRWRLDARAMVSVGFVHQEVAIRGRTDMTAPGSDVTSLEGGFLALPSNIGTHDRTQFAWIPELNLTLRRSLRGGLWAHAGYSLMWLNDVVRAPDHIDTTINPNQLPPSVAAGDRPAFQFQSSDELIHGLNAGLQWNY